MTIKPLIECIDAYKTNWCAGGISYPGINLPEELKNANTIRLFAGSTQDCFRREHLEGHITGSALITDQSLSLVLLTHHKRLNKWLQLGGHSDGHHLTWEVAMREAEEESGLQELSFFDRMPWKRTLGQPSVPLIFDMDYHEIPARKDEKAHIHYDVRYLIVAKTPSAPVVSDESHDVRWFKIDEARQVTEEKSMHRQFNKLDALRIFALRK